MIPTAGQTITDMDGRTWEVFLVEPTQVTLRCTVPPPGRKDLPQHVMPLHAWPRLVALHRRRRLKMAAARAASA